MDKKHFANKLGKNASENSSLVERLKVTEDLNFHLLTDNRHSCN